MTRNKMRRRRSQQTGACGMQRSALLGLFGLLAGGGRASSNYTTIVYTAKGAQPDYDQGFINTLYNTEGLPAEVTQHQFEEPDEFTFWLGPQGATTAEALLNKTHECDFRWGLVNALETQGMLAEVELTHACITVELGVGCDEGHALSPYCPTNRTTTHKDDLAAGAIIAIVVGVLIAIGVLCGCLCLYYYPQTPVYKERYVQRRASGFDMPPVAFYEEK